jgi:signal transduction histidine kinase
VASVIVAVVLALTLVSVLASRNGAMNRAAALVESQASALSEHANQVFVTIDRMLDAGAADMNRVNLGASAPHSDDFQRWVDAYPYIEKLVVLDSAGHVVMTSEPAASVQADQSADPAYIAARNAPSTTGLQMLGPPRPGDTVVVFYKPIAGANNVLQGVAEARINFDYFNRHYLEVNQAFDMQIALVQSSGDYRILASTFDLGSGQAQNSGKPLSQVGYFEGAPLGYMPDNPDEPFKAVPAGPALVGFRTLAPWPAVIAVAFPKSLLFTGWFGSVASFVVSSLAFILVLAVMIRVMLRQSRYKDKIEQALEANRANLEYRVKRRTSELRAERDKAEIANKAKSVTLARVSHELRVPLNSAMGFSESIRDDVFGDDPERYRLYAGYVLQAGDYMRRVMDDLLDLSKIDTGKYKLREDKFHLGTLLSDCVNATRQRAQTKNIRVDSYLHGPDFHLYADRRAMRQVVMNILANGVKYNRKGGAVTVNFGLDPAGGGATISIEDNGIGIKPEDLSTVMEPMTRAHKQANGEDQGTGLGLPMAKSLVELHGGEISIVSDPGKGTTVYINLPESRVMDVDHTV